MTRAHDRRLRAPNTEATSGARRAEVAGERLLALQRRIGNAAMTELVSREREEATPGALVEHAIAGPGSALPQAIQRAADEAGLNTSGVRVHEGPAVESAARRINALAFTTSRPGMRPAIGITRRVTENPTVFRRTMLEETFHSHQQNEGRVDGTPFEDTMMSHPLDRHEREAQDWSDENA